MRCFLHRQPQSGLEQNQITIKVITSTLTKWVLCVCHAAILNGRYSLEGLAAGKYRVTLVVNGAVKVSINNTALEPGESTQLNFKLKQERASVTETKGKHWV
jgi:hypothetical protein